MMPESDDNESSAAKSSSIANPPGLHALSYRIGAYNDFKAAMTDALAGKEVLHPLAHAGTDDPTVAIVDAWAVALDVLTFYQERIADEGFLRTATELRSVQELGRAVGYELNPGIAAETWLAFTLEDAPGAPEKVIIDNGTKAQSIPGPGELPQIFETAEQIEARPEWNLFRLQKSKMRMPQKGDTETFLDGVNTGLKPGDAILIVGEERKNNAGNENWDFRRIKTIEPDKAGNHTKVTWDEKLGHDHPLVYPTRGSSPEVHAFRLRAALFGYNAPDWAIMPGTLKEEYCRIHEFKADDKEWPNFTINGISGQGNTTSPYTVHLDAAYPQIRPDSWLVLASPTDKSPSYVELYRVKSALEDSRTYFTLSAKTTRVTLEGENMALFDDCVRETMVFAHSEKLTFAETPLSSEYPPNNSCDGENNSTITLDCCPDGISVGRVFLIVGTVLGTDTSESNCVKVLSTSTDPDSGRCIVSFSPPLKSVYNRESMIVYANVARATHGETRQEVLGSGDASRPFQSFALRQAPLTFTPAATQTGGMAALKVGVDGILWDQAAKLYGLAPRDRMFTASQGADGKYNVQFGNGTVGARLPTGSENVTASYRVGLGAAGNVKADQLRILLSRLLGVKGVTNPCKANGGVDPEDADDARRNVPFTALTIERIVSLHDYEDFARAYGGIAKARADWLWNGSSGVIFVTVTDADGAKMDDAPYGRLSAAIDKVRDPAQHVLVESAAAKRFRIQARLVLDPHYHADDVSGKAQAALRRAFSIKQREFGQDVTECEILAMLQSMDGVVAADMLEPYPGSDQNNYWESDRRIVSQLSRLDMVKVPPEIIPAELWVLEDGSDAVTLKVVSNLTEPEQT
jgi:hypothetical protein